MTKYPPSRVAGFKRRWPARTVLERFLSHVTKTEGCWLWTGAQHSKFGYGSFGMETGRIVKSHRAAWELLKGSIPDGLHVLHKCDNPPCVNPEHLFLGTNSDNILDCTLKGRSKMKANKGVRNGRSKLTEEQVRNIRASDLSIRALAREYKVSRPVIKGIKRGTSWRHI